MPFELSTHIHNWKRSNFDKWSISIYTFRIVSSFGYIKEDCGSVVPSWAQCSGGVPWARPCQHQEDRPWALILWLGLGPTELELGCPPLQPHFHHQTRGCCQSQSHTENPCRNHHSHRFPSFPVLPAHAGANVQCFHHRDCSAYSKTMRYIKKRSIQVIEFLHKIDQNLSIYSLHLGNLCMANVYMFMTSFSAFFAFLRSILNWTFSFTSSHVACMDRLIVRESGRGFVPMIYECVCTYGCIIYIYICNGDISPDICSYIMRVVVYPYGPTCRPGFKIRHSSWNFGSSVRRQGSPENWRWDGNGESKDRHYSKIIGEKVNVWYLWQHAHACTTIKLRLVSSLTCRFRVFILTKPVNFLIYQESRTICSWSTLVRPHFL